MTVLWSMLIVTISAAAPKEAHYPGASEVFSCAFDQSSDLNYDGWPDNWSRRRGKGFPQYIPIQIVADRGPGGQHSLAIELDGGGAVAQSPPIPVRTLYDSVAECYVRTEGLKHDRAMLSVAFLDKDQRPLETYRSVTVGGTTGWTRLQLSPLSPSDPQIETAVVGLHLEPTDEADLRGSAHFAGVWMGRLPRITLGSGNRLQLFSAGEPVNVTCKASGFSPQETDVEFRLLDVWGTPLNCQKRPLKRSAVSFQQSAVSGQREEKNGKQPLVGWSPQGLASPRHGPFPEREGAPDRPSSLIPHPPSLPDPLPEAEGVRAAQWQPRLSGPGFYRVQAQIRGPGGVAFRRQITLAVIQPERSPLGSEFGWSLPDSQRPLALSELTRLLSQAGIRWVKYPLWCDEEQREAHLDKITRLSDALLGQEIELVGLLARPPEALRTRLEAPAAVSAAEVFTAGSKVWYPSVEAVLARLATQVHYWQLGDDLDASFVGYPRLTEQMTEVKRALDRIGQNVSIGFGWNWISPLPAASGSTPPWRFLSLSADPPLTAGEMAVALDATRGSSAARWVVVQPLPGDQYTLESRVIDLVQRMVAAKVHGADAVFVANPFGGREGLLAADGTPGELLLPWRTTALRLGGAKYLGRIDLPQGSPNEIFAGDGPPVMVVWSDAPAREIVELGPGVRQLDLWGRWTTPSRQRDGQVIEVDRLPKFLVGLDPALIGWQQSLRLVRQQLPNLLGSRQPNELCIKNPLDRGTSGRIVIAAPTGWKIEPAEVRFRLARGESLRQPLEITLPGDATCGKYRFQAEIEPYGDPPLRLLVYRPIAVGIGDVTLEIALRKDAQGGLVVEQRFHNHLESPAHFRCLLYAPGRRREKTEVHLIGPGSDLQSYHLPQAAQLSGQTLWLHADEIDGPRAMNYRILVTE